MHGDSARQAWVRERLVALDQDLPEPPARPDRAGVGFDGTGASVAAARWAGALADAVDLIAAVPPDPSKGLGPIERGEAEQWAEGVRARLPEALRSLTGTVEDVPMELHKVQAPPAEALETTASDLGDGLLVLGTDPKGKLDRLLINSVSEERLHQATEPTLVVRGPPQPGPVLVGLGIDPGSPLAAAWGLTLARELDRSLVLLHATDDPASRTAFESDHEADIARLAEPTPARALLHAAEETGAALVVVGHDPRRAFGGTGIELLRDAPCSVFIARPPIDPSRGPPTPP